MKAKYKEVRKMEMEAMRNLCIAEELYDKANFDEYDEFLYSVEKCENVTTEKLEEFAEEIIRHSSNAENHPIEHLMWLIAHNCYTYFVEKE